MMRYLRDTEENLPPNLTIGGKATNLFRLKKLGLRVPSFLVLPVETLEIMFSENSAESDINRIVFEISRDFGDARFFAVRSSAADEDGADFSFAGQFETFLYVPATDLKSKIRAVWDSAFSDRVKTYQQHHQLLGPAGIAVIIQEMLDPEVAGVAFGVNPVNGNVDEKLISAVYGLGEGLVSGELNADHFTLKNGNVYAEIVEKTEAVTFSNAASGGTIKIAVAEDKQNAPTLSDDQIREIGQMLDQLQKEFGAPQDIEFAFQNGQLYLLQTRPVTTLKKQFNTTGHYILWDNSNIIESYPGVTTPLTFSFISKSYETAYKLFSAYLGVSDAVIRQNERVFSNTLGFLNGRVYYNLRTWYHMLAMLPGYSINARFMEKMMGVKERFDIPESYQLSKGRAWWRIVKMAGNMYLRWKSLPRKRREFMELLNQTITEYKAIDYDSKTAYELMQLYLNFEKTLLDEWKAPLLNDFFAMIWFGMLQKQCEKYAGAENRNIHNDLLCGSSDIISVEPVHRSIRLASQISENPGLKALFTNKNEAEIWAELIENKHIDFVSIKKEIDRYIADFGERCVGELKLETVSYTQDPTAFIRILKSYVETGITSAQISGSRELEIRQKAEQEINRALKGGILQKLKFRRTLNKARELVSARENLRYERTRAFGIVRQLFSYIGKKFAADGIIAYERDIFFLTKEEIFAYLDGTSVTQEIRGLIMLRKNEFEKNQAAGPLSERFATYGAPYHDNDFFSTDRIERPEGGLKGIGCSPGRVRGKVRVVLNAHEIASLNGDILVTISTDPGWVTLFPGALGIIVERGSLLSHSAIVSREMGKPCIVGVTGLLKTLKTGDEIEMDGSSGIINIIES
ncbi:PEP/pyruvate-binding domain-containing protein [Dyadobacter luticola]|uniref:Phosphoenolpyruvate synthase n=1 Tax=Dyadobacter luticola TaxID=1979387 RepID=A0A5R9L3S4_9BACT|nr:PEP/pyruvate-binding domain-containing protein [Dyadobacter luticola]TLV02920.1 phosphoenolpyruvate synthase [Dyadobacter luticola]